MVAILVVATLLGFLSVFAIWTKRQLLETNTWTNTSTKLLQNQDVQTALGTFMVDQLYANVPVETKLAAALPPKAQPLAGPAAAGLQQLATKLAIEALSRPKVQDLWSQANSNAHALFLKLINGGTDALDTQGGAVTLNLGLIVGQLGQQLGVDVSGKLPPSVAQIELVKSSQLNTVQTIVKALKGVALILPLIALALYALAIYLAQGWRRQAVRSFGISFAVIGILVLAVHTLLGNILVDGLAKTDSVKPAVRAAWEIGSSLLRDGGVAMLGYGVVIFLGAVLCGPLGIAKRARRNLAPLLRERWSAYAAILVIILLLIWWAPTAGFQRLLPSLVLFGLLIAGVEALRQQTNREYPDETWETLGERWAHGFSNLRRGREPATAAGPGAGRVADLERLAGLRDSGVLSPEEFEAEKKRVLAGQ